MKFFKFYLYPIEANVSSKPSLITKEQYEQLFPESLRQRILYRLHSGYILRQIQELEKGFKSDGSTDSYITGFLKLYEQMVNDRRSNFVHLS